MFERIVPRAEDEASDEHVAAQRAVLIAINTGLTAAGHSPFVEPADEITGYGSFQGNRLWFGRASCDHHFSRVLRELGQLDSSCRHLALMSRADECDIVFVPIAFEAPIPFADPASSETKLLGSSIALGDELVAVAPRLGIFLDGEDLRDETALAMNDAEPFGPQYPEAHDLGSGWLLVFEGARSSRLRGTALRFR